MFIYGFLTLHWHPMPLGLGRGQNVGLRDFCHILALLPRGTSVFHKQMSSSTFEAGIKLFLCVINGYIWWVLYIYYRPKPSTATTGGNSWADKVRGASSTTPPKAGSAPLQPSPQPVLPSPPPKQNGHSSDTDGSTTIEGQDFHIIYL